MQNFTLKQLRYVEAAGRLGSIAMAALDQSISQSSISAAIDTYESEVGYDIFVRTPAKGVKPTALGNEVLKAIRRFLDQARHFDSEVASIDGQATGAVRIGCYATAAPSILPNVLKSFTLKHPGISIKLFEGNMETTMKFLAEGECDLVFSYDETVGAGQSFVPLFGAPPYALVPNDHPLSRLNSVSFAELNEMPMVMLDLPRTREYFTTMFNQHGLTPNIVHSTQSSEITRALVAGGFGFSILNIRPPDYGSRDLPYSVLPIRDRVRVPIFGLVTPDVERRPRIISAFIDHCLELNAAGKFTDLVVTQASTQSAIQPIPQKNSA